MNQGAGLADNSPVLTADPGDERFVVLATRLDAPDFGCALQVSGDRGRTYVPVRPVPQLPPGAQKCYAPEVAFDRTGTLYFLFLGLAGEGNQPMGAFLTTSADRGRTFAPPRQVLGPLNFGVRMAIDPTLGRSGRLVLAWLHAGAVPALGAFGPQPNPVMAAYSDDGGRTFSAPVQVSDPQRRRVVAPALALGPGHAVHVAYYDLGDDARDYEGLEGPVWDGTWSLLVASSSDGGRRFTPSSVVDAGIGPPERVMLIFTMPAPALVATATRLCAAWTDARLGDADVMARCSADHGRRWGRPVRVNDDRRGNGARQYLPRLAAAPGGRIDALFYDRRDDPNGIRNHAFFASSTDGGRHFGPNRRLSEEPSDARIGQRYVGPAAQGLVEIGSRLGLASRPDGAVAAWTDTRNSAPGTTAQDVFATTVEVSHTGRRRWPALAGWALAGTGAVLLLGAAASARRRRGRHPGQAPDGESGR